METPETRERMDEAQAWLAAIVDCSDDAIIGKTLDGIVTSWNSGAERMYGYSADEIVGKSISLLLPPHRQGELADILERVGRGERIDHYETVRIHKDGREMTISATVSPVKVSDGVIVGASTIARDITVQKRIEAGLREKEEEYRGIFEATTDGLVVTDLDSILAEVNPAFCRMHGYEPGEMLGMDPRQFVHPDSHSTLQAYLREVSAGRDFQATAVDVRKDGSPFPVEVRGTAINYRGQPHILGVVRDITERVQAYETLEHRVAERTRELSTLLEVSRRLSSVLELRPLLALILDQLKVVADYSGSSALNLQDDSLVIVETRGRNPEEHLIGRRFPLAQMRELWDVLQRGEPIIIDDVRSGTALANVYRMAVTDLFDTTFNYVRAWMAVPLMHKHAVIGMLSLSYDEPGFYSEHHARLALGIASQAAVAIENARLYQQAQQLAAVEERARLARDLHDSVTQALFSMTMHARAAQEALRREGGDPNGMAAGNLRQLAELTHGALAEMRALIFELRPGALSEEGLVTALRKHAVAVSSRERITVEVKAPQDRLSLSPATEEHLYRLAREALHNVVKHAKATKVMIAFQIDEDDAVMLEVVDNGVGFEVDAVGPGHMGLRTMQDRAGQIGGALEIHSVLGQGTTIRVVAPMSGRGDRNGTGNR